jgi:hypothetical protein
LSPRHEPFHPEKPDNLETVRKQVAIRVARFIDADSNEIEIFATPYVYADGRAGVWLNWSLGLADTRLTRSRDDHDLQAGRPELFVMDVRGDVHPSVVDEWAFIAALDGRNGAFAWRHPARPDITGFRRFRLVGRPGVDLQGWSAMRLHEPRTASQTAASAPP